MKKHFIFLISFLLMVPFAIAMEEDTEKLKELSVDNNRQRLTLKSPHIAPGLFYRSIDSGKNMKGVYAKNVFYEEEDLFKDSVGIESVVFKCGTKAAIKNYLGVVFFGIWSDKKKNYVIEVPVQETYSPQSSRPIWRTECVVILPIVENEYTYSFITCNGRHTEEVFADFIKKSENQNNLWKCFLKASDEINENARKLESVGFKYYSTNDACDNCHKELLNLQENHETLLPDLPPKPFVQDRKIPFLMLFHGQSFYYPGFNNEHGSSLFFYPKILFKLSGFNGYNGQNVKEEEIEHQEIKLKSQQQPTFIFYKVNHGIKRKVFYN